MNSKGFSLVELLVVIAILIMVITAVVGIFIYIMQHQIRVLQEESLLDQESYIMEYISKALRMAKKDPTGSCIPKGDDYQLVTDNSALPNADIKFINGSNGYACEEFFFDGTSLKDGSGNNLISDRFKINNVKFVLDGDLSKTESSERDLSQPRVTFLLDIENTIYGKTQRKVLQTTVSQRDLNIRQ